MDLDFFTVFYALIWTFAIGCIYLAVSFSKEQMRLKDSGKEIEYRLDQRICLNISVLAFWVMVIYSTYTVMEGLIKWAL